MFFFFQKFKLFSHVFGWIIIMMKIFFFSGQWTKQTNNETKKIICIFKLKRKRTDKNDFLLNQKIDLFDKIFFLSSQYKINGAIDKGKDSIDVILYHLNDIYIGRGIVYRFYWLAGVAHLLYYRTMFNQQNGQPISIDTTVCVCVWSKKKKSHTHNKQR